MSGDASAASEDSAAQNCLDSDNKRTLPHDAEPDADIHSESYEEPGAQIHSKNKRKPDADIQSESYEEPVPHIQSESYEEPVAESHSESYEEPVAENHSESYEDPVPDIHSEGKRKPDAEIQSESYEHPFPQIHSESYEEPVAEIHSQSKGKPVAEIHSQSKRKPDAENHSESYEEPVPEILSEGERERVTEIPSKSERETVPEILSKSKSEPVPEIPSKNERDPVPEIPSQSEREPVPELSSPSKRQIEPAPKIPSESEIEPAPKIPSESERNPFLEIASRIKRKPRSRKILTETERESDAESDDEQQRLYAESYDGQQRLPGQSPYGKKPRGWISEEEWLEIIKAGPRASVRSLSDVSIFKIPDFLKDTKREAYVPQRVLLGPYHHGSKKLRAIDHYKEIALGRIKTRFNKETASKNDADFACNAIEAILKNEGEIRDSYEESIDCDEKCLARMLCVDGCFILEVLKDLDNRGVNDSLFGENMIFASNALKDILMLENQIPWIVLIELLRLENPKEEHVKSALLSLMVKGTCGSFKMSSEDRSALLRLDWLESATTKVHHLLDFVHKVIVYRPANHANPGNQGEYRICIDRCIDRCIGRCLPMLPDENKELNHDCESIPPAVELKNAGIKFRPCSGGIKHIEFDPHTSTIYLPLLSITSDTEVLFRNLIAFEICRPSELNYVCSYVNLMGDLIDSQNDVAFLRSVGILTNLLGSDQEVADLFNGLFKGVTVTMPNIFDEQREKVNANYKKRIRVQLAELWRDHFSSPWKAIALAVAFAILCLTLIQTIYTVKK